MANPKLQRTKNYSQFSFTKENRDVDLINLRPQHKKLRESIRTYGFLPAFPIMVVAVNGRFVIKDGQHRFTFAKEFGLEVYFVVDDKDVRIDEINGAQATWTVKDYAKRWASAGLPDYIEALAFMDEYGVSISRAFGMLAGTNTFGNISRRFNDGEYRVKARDFAHRVGGLYKDLTAISPRIKNQRLLDALWSCCHVDHFDDARLIQTATRRPEMLVPAGRVDSALEVLEEIYNFGRRSKVPLKFDAEQAMKSRKDNFGTRNLGKRAIKRRSNGKGQERRVYGH